MHSEPKCADRPKERAVRLGKRRVGCLRVEEGERKGRNFGTPGECDPRDGAALVEQRAQFCVAKLAALTMATDAVCKSRLAKCTEMQERQLCEFVCV